MVWPTLRTELPELVGLIAPTAGGTAYVGCVGLVRVGCVGIVELVGQPTGMTETTGLARSSQNLPWMGVTS